MWVRFAVAAVAFLALGHAAAAAPAWFCDPAQAYYPWVRSCPVPWRMVNPRSAWPPSAPSLSAPPLAAPSSSVPAIAAPAPQTTAEPGEAPGFKPVTFPARGDALDGWCKAATSGPIVAVCSDDELRSLAVERLRAFNEASQRLTADQQKTLVGDQNGWALSYPQRCGLSANVLPSLPLAPETRECMAKAGRSRLAYLRNYVLSQQASSAAATDSPIAAANSPAVAEASPAKSAESAPPPQVVIPPVPAAAATPRTSPNSAAAQDTAAPPAQTPALTLPAPAPAPSAATSTHPSRLAASPSVNPAAGKGVSIGAVHGAAAAAALVVAAFAVGLWLWAAWRHRRGGARETLAAKR